MGREVTATVEQVAQSMNAIEQALQARHFNEARNLLLKLSRLTVTVDLLTETGIGKFVGKLRKRTPAFCSLYFRYPSFCARHSNPQVREIARTCVVEFFSAWNISGDFSVGWSKSGRKSSSPSLKFEFYWHQPASNYIAM